MLVPAAARSGVALSANAALLLPLHDDDDDDDDDDDNVDGDDATSMRTLRVPSASTLVSTT